MTLLLVAHGTRDPAGTKVVEQLAFRVRVRLPDVRVAVAFADVRGPDVATALSALPGPAVVVPAFLASGYHVRVDVPEQVRRATRHAVLTLPLGPAPALVTAAHERLVEAGWRPGDPVVLAAAGSSDERARADVARAAALLGARTAGPVRIGYAATSTPRIGEAVSALGERAAVASWLLAPGRFHRMAADSGAAVVADPLGAHPRVVDLLVRRYLEARSCRSSIHPG